MTSNDPAQGAAPTIRLTWLGYFMPCVNSDEDWLSGEAGSAGVDTMGSTGVRRVTAVLIAAKQSHATATESNRVVVGLSWFVASTKCSCWVDVLVRATRD
jgi:hypothetical protein